MSEMKLGDKARDTLTGCTGVVVAITQWLHGCRAFTLQPQELKDGQPVKASTFDNGRLEPAPEPQELRADREVTTPGTILPRPAG